jgi:hypothetical protein
MYCDLTINFDNLVPRQFAVRHAFYRWQHLTPDAKTISVMVLSFVAKNQPQVRIKIWKQ